MKFCTDHWEKIRAAVDARGLRSLVPTSAQEVLAKMTDQLLAGEERLDNYDPLMAVHWMIAGNVLLMLEKAGNGGALYLIADDDASAEDPIDPELAGEKYRGRTWPRCPLCYLNIAHEMSCTNAKCTLDKVNGYDWMVDRAADDAKKFVDEMVAKEHPVKH